MRESTLTTRTGANQALDLMLRFAERTGLTSDAPPVRYLWTDAFAVCNFLGLGRTDLALLLVEQVHQTLGRRRDDDHRSGWISGLADQEAEAHPTAGGLRIGKSLPERLPDEPFDERFEWDRDGQYFHYLTKWMHALDQVTRWTGDPTFNRWARELADAAHEAFTYSAGPGGRRMYWKTSIDLTRAVVPSMGHHDPLDGYVTCLQLQATAARLPDPGGPDLDDEIADFVAMIPRELATADPLGIGGLLTDACRLDQLTGQVGPDRSDLRDRLLRDALLGLTAYLGTGELQRPAEMRLAFRELGLAIGLAAVPLLGDGSAAESKVTPLHRFTGLREEIQSFWLRAEHREATSWLEHENINEVMLATSLAPEGYLALR
jgi:hypothetical protein